MWSDVLNILWSAMKNSTELTDIIHIIEVEYWYIFKGQLFYTD